MVERVRGATMRVASLLGFGCLRERERSSRWSQ